jgi:hypothetical protein
MEGGSPSPDNVGVDGGGDMYTTRRMPAPHGRDDPLLVGGVLSLHPKSNINLNSEFGFFDRKEKIIRDLLI